MLYITYYDSFDKLWRMAGWNLEIIVQCPKLVISVDEILERELC